MSNGRKQDVLPQEEHLQSERPTENSPLLSPDQEIRHVPTDGAGPKAITGRQNNGSSSGQDHEGEGRGRASQTVTLLQGVSVTFAIACLIFLQGSNISMLTTIQSSIAEELDAYDAVTYFSSVYLIAMSALGPLNGKLSSIFSPRTCIFFASMLLAVGVVICAWAKSLEVFLIGRAVTGIGASGVYTISIIIVLELTDSKRKGLAMGLLNSGYTFGVAAGATVAGALVDVVGWRALFYIQSPIAILGGTILLLAIPNEFTAGKTDDLEEDRSTWDRISKIDYLGAITLTTSLGFLLSALSAPKSIPIWPIVISVAVGAVFAIVETYWASDPIIPISLLTSRGLLLTCLGTVGYMMARWSVLFYTPTFAIAVRQWSPSIGGALLIPTNGGFAAGGLLVGWLHIKRPGSFYLPTLITYALFPVTLVLLATLAHREGSAAGFVVVLIVCGCTTGAALNYNLAHLLHLTPKSTHYVATALLATFRGFAGSFGAAIGGGIFTRTLATSLKKQFAEHGMKRDLLVRQLLGSPKLVGHLSGVEREVAIKGYEDGLKTLWLCAAVLALAMVLVQAGVGFRGHEEKMKVDEERQALLHENSLDE